MNTKHTPGPWRVTGGYDESLYVASEGCGHVPIRTPFRPDAFEHGGDNRSDHTDEELDANAYLIAAAPDLLKACIDLVGSPDLNLESLEPETVNAISRAVSAIAKATGVPSEEQTNDR